MLRREEKGAVKVWIAGALGLLLIGGMAPAQGPNPVGEQFQVNSYATSDQGYYGADVAMAHSGDFVVVWASDGSYGTDTNQASIQGQRFAANGSPQGGEFQVNSYTTGRQRYPVVRVGPVGAFVVVWQSAGSAGTDPSLSIQGQRFAANGSPLGNEFQANTYTTAGQIMADLAVAANGDFVVVWSSFGSYGTDNSYYSIQGQRFAANGSPQGGEFQINSYTTGSQWSPAVAIDQDGDFVVVWSSFASGGTDTSGLSIQGQRFTADGSPQGGEFQINSYTTGGQSWPAVAFGPGGDFVVVWNSPGSYGTDTSDMSIQGQRFAANGSPQRSEFQVNTYTTGHQLGPSVTRDLQGDFVVVWRSEGSYGTDTSYASIQGQRFAASGLSLGDEFQVNSYTTSFQFGPAVSARDQGDFVVSWTSDGSDGTDSSGYSVQGQRFAPPIFADGFESGDVIAWSRTAPCLGCPIAEFTFQTSGLHVSFFNGSTGTPPLSYLWDFGDGTPPSTDTDPTHSYAESGTYNVILKALNHLGMDSVTRAVTVSR